MNRRTRLPRPVREARKLKMKTVTISHETARCIDEVARAFKVHPETVLGIIVHFGLLELEP